MKKTFSLILLAALLNVSLTWFTIKCNQSIDANGKQFIPRGINAGGAYATGANVARVVWRDEDEMASEHLQILTDPDLVKTIQETIKNKMTNA